MGLLVNKIHKCCLLTAVAVIFLQQPVYSESVRIGFVEMDKVMRQNKAVQEIEKHTQELTDKFNDFVREKEREYENRASPGEKLDIMDEIERKRKSLKVATYINNRKLITCRKAIRNVIKKMAKKYKLSLIILRRDSLILIDNYTDLTDKVIRKINEIP